MLAIATRVEAIATRDQDATVLYSDALDLQLIQTGKHSDYGHIRQRRTVAGQIPHESVPIDRGAIGPRSFGTWRTWTRVGAPK